MKSFTSVFLRANENIMMISVVNRMRKLTSCGKFPKYMKKRNTFRNKGR